MNIEAQVTIATINQVPEANSFQAALDDSYVTQLPHIAG